MLVWNGELLWTTESFEPVLFSQFKHVFVVVVVVVCLGISSLRSEAAPLSAGSAHPCMI